MLSLSLLLLGPFQATLNGRPLTNLPTDKIRALLVYLALHPQHAIPRHKLAALFWPEQADGTARQNLRQSLYRLRQALDHVIPESSATLLAISRTTVQLNSPYVTIDVLQFEKMLAQNRVAEAADLYGGELLAGFTRVNSAEFEGWLRIHRESLHQQYMQALTDLMGESLSQQAFARAQRYANKQLAVEPWREEAHQALMKSLALTGHRSDALQQFERCRQKLEEELGVSPSTETELLYKSILHNRLKAVPAPTESQPDLPVYPTPLIGRKRFITELVTAVHQTDAPLFTIVGFGGVGKTRACVAFIEQLSIVGSHLKDDVCFVALNNVTTRPELIGKIRAQLTAKSPEFACPTETGFSADLGQHCRLLILDHIEPNLALVETVQSLLRSNPTLKIVCTARRPLNIQPEQTIPMHGLPYPAPGHQPPQQMSESVQLFLQAAQRLKPDFTLSEENQPAIVRICQLVGGLPLALEMAAAWIRVVAAKTIAAEVMTTIDFLQTQTKHQPKEKHSIRLIFEQCWFHLETAQQQALLQLAVFRHDFTSTAAQTVAYIDADRLSSLSDLALVDVPADGRYRLPPLLKQFALTQTDQVIDQTIALRHAEFYLRPFFEQGATQEEDQNRLAEEVTVADFGNIQQAWRWAFGYGRYQLTHRALSRLILFLQRYRFIEEGCSLLIFAHQQLTQTDGDPEVGGLHGRILIYLADFSDRKGSYRQALVYIDQAESLIANSGETAEIVGLLLLTKGSIYCNRGEFLTGRTFLQEAQAISRQRNQRQLQARSAHLLGNLHWAKEEYDLAQACYTQADSFYSLLGDEEGILAIAGNQGRIAWKKGDYAVALKAYQQIVERLQSEKNDAVAWAVSMGNIGLVYADQANDSLALHYLNKAISMYRQIGDPLAFIEILLAKTSLLLKLGEVEAAVDTHAKAQTLVTQLNNKMYNHLAMLRQAQIVAAQKRHPEAILLLQRLVKLDDHQERLAEAYYELWSLTDAPHHRRQSQAIYQALQEQAPQQKYQSKLELLAH